MRNRIVINKVPAPTLEIDPGARAVYLRFRKGKVARTVAGSDRPGAVLTLDYDAKDELLGVELVGVREFSIKAIRRSLPEEITSQVDFESARFVPAKTVLAA